MPIESKTIELARVRQDLADVMSADRPPAPSPEFRALGDAARTFDIPVSYFEEVIDGVESDLTKTRFADFSELRTYCYKVASVSDSSASRYSATETPQRASTPSTWVSPFSSPTSCAT